MNEIQRPPKQEDLTTETETIKWEHYRSMMRELEDVKKRLGDPNPATHEEAERHLQALVLSASMDLQQTIDGENTQALLAGVEEAIRRAAEDSERKMALAQGLDYKSDKSQ
mgnify:CR=1 FL=1|jgi:hypothetical protein